MTTRLLSAAAILLIAAHPAMAQQTDGLAKVGVLVYGSLPNPYAQAFAEELRRLGHIDGKTVVLEMRGADRKAERMPELARQLVHHHNVDVLVAGSCGALTINAVRQASRTVPLVVMVCGDLPGFVGEVASFARPGGQTTGLTLLGPELSAKRLELLREVQPRLANLAVLWNPAEQGWEPYWRELRAAADGLGVTLHSIEIRSQGTLDEALAGVVSSKAQAILILSDALLVNLRKPIGEFALRRRLLSAGDAREHAAAGLLMTYGANFLGMARRAAVYVDKILKGARPGDLPIERPTKFELVINLKTATALGVTIPPALLLRADELIE